MSKKNDITATKHQMYGGVDILIKDVVSAKLSTLESSATVLDLYLDKVTAKSLYKQLKKIYEGDK